MSAAPLALGGAVGFALGAIPFSWVVARLAGGLDLRGIGSGNVGATNVARALGYGYGAVALFLDAAKGAAAVLAARALAGEGDAGQAAGVVAGGLAVLGHNFTPLLRFRGGKGVATGTGVFAALAPAALLPPLLVFALAVGLTRWVSLGSVLASATLPAAVHFLHGEPRVSALALLVALLVAVRHRANLARIVRGDEPRLGCGGRP